MNYEDLSDELKEKAKACKTPEELLALAKVEGVELGDADLASIAGGEPWACGNYNCPDFDPYEDSHYSYC
jgi:hypothetical protein